MLPSGCVHLEMVHSHVKISSDHELFLQDLHEVVVEYGDPNEPMAEYQQITQQLAEAQRALKTELLAALNATSADAA